MLLSRMCIGKECNQCLMLRDNVCDTMGDGGITLNAMIECVYNTEDQGDG